MIDNRLLPVFLGVLGIMAIGTFVLLREIQRQERLANRIRHVQRNAGQAFDPDEPTGPWLLRIIGSLGNAIARSGLLSTRTIAEFEQTLVTAGFRGGHGLGLFVGSKLLLTIMLPAISFTLLQQSHMGSLLRNGLVLVSAIVGLLGPDYAVRRMRKRHLRMLDRGLPDALDLLVICTEAGLGLEPAIARVATEIRHGHPAVADELSLTANELRVNSDSRAALLNAGTRTGLDGVKRLAMTLTQSVQYGTPLSHALRTLSVEMRQETLTRFEAKAGRLPVLLTVPMIVFILPCVFLIVGGPAILQVLEVLKK